jgi:hypothetical protein
MYLKIANPVILRKHDTITSIQTPTTKMTSPVNVDADKTTVCLHLPYVRFVTQQISPIDISDLDVPPNSFHAVYIDLLLYSFHITTTEMENIVLWMSYILNNRCNYELLMPSALVGSPVRSLENNGETSNLSRKCENLRLCL